MRIIVFWLYFVSNKRPTDNESALFLPIDLASNMRQSIACTNNDQVSSKILNGVSKPTVS